MTVAAGTRLGPYEILAPIGAGGMGEVFKARDTRLERSVAIKILPADFAQNPQFKIRFEREAKTISQLNHPHICTLHDVGSDNGTDYLVMELIDGESLADKLAKGPLPIEQVLRYGIEIASALDRAHKAGVVHRDLKPGNIMITKSGAKLLDFGLAKDAVLAGASSATLTAAGPTVQKPLTAEGTIVGTLNYMAPEQLEAGNVDSRTDIFALGAVLYEMATGKRAFDAKSKASLIATILAAEPKPISALQPMTPSALDRIVRSCLQKDPDERWQSAHDVALELRSVGEGEPARPPVRKPAIALPWSVAALVAVAAMAAAFFGLRERAALREEPEVRTSILPPEKTNFDFLNAGAPPAISRDGTKVVFGAAEPGKVRTLWVRQLDSLVARPLAGTDGATFPFWSPDGNSIAFFADNTLKRMDVAGGAPVVLCNVTDARGGSWSPDGRTIVFAGRFTPIYRVPSSGGTPVQITNTTPRMSSHRWPEFLPDSRHFLFLSSPLGAQDPSNTICVGDIQGGTEKPLITTADDPHYLDGHILFTRNRILTAQAFDSRSLEMTGEPFPLKEQQIELTTIFSRSVVSIAANGTAILQNGATTRTTQLGWFDRSGKMTGVLGDPAPYVWASISPDQKNVLVSYAETPQANIWAFDITRGVKSRVTFRSREIDDAPLWSPDGRRMLYSSLSPGNRFSIILHDLATGTEQKVTEGTTAGAQPLPTSWDGQRVLYQIGTPATRSDIFLLSLGDGRSRALVSTPFNEGQPRFSPDGKWFAYFSDETGNDEVYIAPFPPTGAKWQVSTNGGLVPRWRSDGRELYYVTTTAVTSDIMAVPISLGASPQIGSPLKLFTFRVGYPTGGLYDVSADGQRFLVNVQAGDQLASEPMTLVQHLDRELRDAERRP